MLEPDREVNNAIKALLFILLINWLYIALIFTNIQLPLTFSEVFNNMKQTSGHIIGTY